MQLLRVCTNWKLQWLFSKWDTDASGTISRKELREALAELGLGNSQKNKIAIDALFGAMDTDKSGEVSYDEFEMAIRASLRTAKSEALKSTASGASANAIKLPVISSHYSKSSEPSPRNRVGRIGGYAMRDRQHIICSPSPHKRFVAKSPRSPSPMRPSESEQGFQTAANGVAPATRPRTQPPQRIACPALRMGESSHPRAISSWDRLAIESLAGQQGQIIRLVRGKEYIRVIDGLSISHHHHQKQTHECSCVRASKREALLARLARSTVS